VEAALGGRSGGCATFVGTIAMNIAHPLEIATATDYSTSSPAPFPASATTTYEATNRPTSSAPSRAMRDRGTTRSRPASSARCFISTSTWE
jgi:hypothetical protein